jgi:purine-binding chemotaxis protein CheW
MDGDALDPQVDPVDAWLASVSDDPPPIADAGTDPAAPTLLDAVLAADQSIADAGVQGGGDALPAAGEDRPIQRYVLFSVADTTYGVPDAFVTEVERVPKTTPVPHTPAWLRGVTSLRGDVVSVIDLRRFLGLDSPPPPTGRLLVVRLVDQEFATGLLVDTVEQIVSVPVDEVRPPVSPVAGALADFLTGACQVNERFVAVLDLDRLLRSPDVRQFDDGKDAIHEERSCEARI